MKAVVLSDVHLGYENSEVEAFRAFLDELPDIQPDYFIICGDFIEMWRRDMVAPVLEYCDILAKLKELNRQMSVILIAGNHDWHVMRMGRPLETYPPPFQFKEVFSIHMDGFYYSFKHGHQYDPLCRHPRPNNSLCYTPEDTTRLEPGHLVSWFRGKEPMLQLHGYIPRISRRRILDPGYISKMPALIDIVRWRARISRHANEFLIHGHTHSPLLDTEGMYADTGCWVDGSCDYLLIEDNVVSLMRYE